MRISKQFDLRVEVEDRKSKVVQTDIEFPSNQ